ncbi:uncharacterized protein LOC106656522 isoform X1 [Trichogramma pretiosum]|uniref:uncharacterized protein LOC106656522 isoform X1 n=1 Tax=Trichogramma pretiosum TaxID=7493 RepID=UPI0006C976F6|nr:uncharacterized protein LOC106656522 isoform X1 [Trichogramma pretiosum]
MPSPSESPVPPPQQQQQQQLLPSSCLNGVPLEVELSKNHKLAEADVISVKSWSERRYDLPSLGESDAALFLHARNYDCERAKLLLENFFGMRRRLGCFFGQRDPDSSQLRTLFNTLYIGARIQDRVPVGKEEPSGPHRRAGSSARHRSPSLRLPDRHQVPVDGAGRADPRERLRSGRLHIPLRSEQRHAAAQERALGVAATQLLRLLQGLLSGQVARAALSRSQARRGQSLQEEQEAVRRGAVDRDALSRVVSLAPDDRQHRQDHPSGRSTGRAAGHERAQPRREPSAPGAEARRLSRLVPPHGPDLLLLSLSRSRALRRAHGHGQSRVLSETRAGEADRVAGCAGQRRRSDQRPRRMICIT